LVYGSTVAADATGLVVAARGTVNAEAQGVQRPLKQGDHIFVKDKIVSGDRSFAVLQFSDGAKVTVRPNSAMIIENYVYNGDENDVAVLGLVEGGLRVITGAMTKQHPESYKVKTPVALMGVRGTQFAVMLCDQELCLEDVKY
jgi:hypothetical protein